MQYVQTAWALVNLGWLVTLRALYIYSYENDCEAWVMYSRIKILKFMMLSHGVETKSMTSPFKSAILDYLSFQTVFKW